MAGSIPTVRLRGGLEIPRIINGMWQLAGGHGRIDPQKAVEEMVEYCRAGLTAFDMADIYGPAEDIYGTFITKMKTEVGEDALKNIQGLTKFVPRPGPMTKQVVEKALQRSMQRMKVSRLDGVQFHWWDYSDSRYLEAMTHLAELQAEGKIGELALTNFDTERMMEMTKKGLKISSNQVQFSLIDMRPSVKMAPFCEANGIKLLTYGTLAGGLISEKYLGKPEPTRSELTTSSLSKYKRVIDTWGGWGLFQELLGVLSGVAKRHGVTVANVATRWVLDQPAVGAVIVGCRFGVAGCNHVAENLRAFQLQLTQQDRDEISNVLRKGRDLMAVIGDCGDEYR